jgi:hypothetical protein
MPQELLLPQSEMSSETGDLNEWRSTMILRLQAARELAIAEEAKTIEYDAERYNRNRHDVNFDIGQLVLIYRVPPESQNFDPTRRTRKLSTYSSGPWRVLERLPNNNFRLRHIRAGHEDIFNVDTMVPFRVRHDDAAPTSVPDLESDSNEGSSDDDFADPFDTASDTESEADDEILDRSDQDDPPYHCDGTRLPTQIRENHSGSAASKKGGYRATPSSRSLRAVPDRLSRAAEARQARSGGDSDGDDP